VILFDKVQMPSILLPFFKILFPFICHEFPQRKFGSAYPLTATKKRQLQAKPRSNTRCDIR
jgi:hypothetical protein